MLTEEHGPGGIYVNWSPACAGLVPSGVVTVTSTTPAACAGLVTVIFVSETTTTFVPAAAPKCTEVAPVNPHPVRVTEVPPAVEPKEGETPSTAGAVP